MKIRTVAVSLKGLSPYSQGRAFQSEPAEGEKPDAFDLRCWRERIHADDSGRAFIPGRSIKGALAAAAAHLGKKIKGRGNKTWKAAFSMGVQAEGHGLLLDAAGQPVTRENFPLEMVYAYAQGRKSETEGRVWRRFPTIPAGWATTARLLITDPTIGEKDFAEHLEVAGVLIGLGRYRAENEGEYGLFRATKIEWED